MLGGHNESWNSRRRRLPSGHPGHQGPEERTAHKAAVATTAQVLKLKEGAETIVDEAKAEIDDILAEAGYEKAEEEAEAEETEEEAAKELEEAQEAEGK